ncbi:MAG: FKBP-type peptidyl-prolyl cis-trans isomerase [Actinobacteria bacterium]|nr:FKBP-type peptidyl-prolyl cis-trans isomerase [Actinomycetota bacterium]
MATWWLAIALIAVALGGCGNDGGGGRGDTGSHPTRRTVHLGQEPHVTVPDEPPPRELTVDDLVVGDGPSAAPGDIATFHDVGVRHADGEELDSSWNRGIPARFSLAQVLPGFAKGIAGTDGIEAMRVGGRRVLILPPHEAYGENPPGGGPADTLIFVVDLVALDE